MKKKYLAYAFLPVLALSLLVAGTTYASSIKTSKNNPFSVIADAIAKKFNLATTDVQEVIDETMSTKHAQIEKNRPERIDPVAQAIKDGKLTQAQADLIAAKKAEIKTATENLKNTTPVEMAAAMKTQADSLKQWAADNNIPEKYIMLFGGRGQGRSAERGLGGQRFNKNDLHAPKSQ